MTPAPVRAVAVIGLVLALAIGGGCSTAKEPRLHGVWSGAVAGGSRMFFAFRPDESARWMIFDLDIDEAFEVRYRVDTSITPHHLDLYGFTQGPLLGRTLYGIFEFESDDVFRFDCEPGLMQDASPRPTAFGPEAVRCVRFE